MKTLKFKNSQGEEITFTNAAPFWLTDFTQDSEVESYSLKGAGQDGSKYLGNTINDSGITLKVSVIGRTKKEFDQIKAKLRRLFNPKINEGMLIKVDNSNEQFIKCIPEKIPFIVNKNDRRGECIISLIANNPMWADLLEEKHEITLWVPNFSFPLELPSEGMEIGYRSEILTANANNTGDVETGMRIVFKALASVTNPSLVNINTKEQIKINTTMVKGQQITITTGYGNKKIISRLGGVDENIFNTLEAGSTFLQLTPGDNLFRYNADDGIDYLSVTIYHQNRYLGV